MSEANLERLVSGEAQRAKTDDTQVIPALVTSGPSTLDATQERGRSELTPFTRPLIGTGDTGHANSQCFRNRNDLALQNKGAVCSDL